MDRSPPQVSTLSQYLVDEILLTVGLSQNRWGRQFLSPVFALPSIRLSQIALAFDAEIEKAGLPAAFAGVLPNFANGFHTWGETNLPPQGPLLIISNHPGTVDSILISAPLPRADLKIIAGISPFTRALPALRRHLIFSSQEPTQRMMVIREGIRHLRAGGALLLFPGVLARRVGKFGYLVTQCGSFSSASSRNPTGGGGGEPCSAPAIS